ncbi:MAG: cytochrome C oxidase subunit IV family protein [Myxococcales bacterium]
MNDKAHSVAHQEDHNEHHVPMGRYVAVWIALLVLTVVTYVTGKMHFGDYALHVAMVIATVKAALVALFFMHLWDSEGTSRVVMVISVIFLATMLLGVFGDITQRFRFLLPDGSHRNPVPGAIVAPATPAHDAHGGH